MSSDPVWNMRILRNLFDSFLVSPFRTSQNDTMRNHCRGEQQLAPTVLEPNLEELCDERCLFP